MLPFRWTLKTWENYCRACSDCELALENPSAKVWGSMQRKMVSMHKSGRVLATDVPGTDLRKGDRFEPVPDGLWDWQDLQGERFAGKIGFWRSKMQGMAKHRNPLFDKALGSDAWSIIAIDSMHTWCLGIHQHFLAGLLWSILGSNLLAGKGVTQEDRHHHSMAELNKRLLVFYKAFEQREGYQLSRLELRLEILGKRTVQNSTPKLLKRWGF